MLITSLAALAIGILAPIMRSVAWAVPHSMFSHAMVLRSAIGAALTTFVAGALATLAFEDHVAGAIGAGLGGLLAFTAARRARYLRGTALLCYRLTQPAHTAEAAQLLDVRLRNLAPHLKPEGYAQLALFASVPLTAVGRWKEAADHVERVELGGLDPALRQRVLQALATLRLEHGDLEGASEALAKVERPAADAVERWLQATEALLLVIQGNTDGALALAEAHDDPEDAAIAASYAVVRAHAFASRGDDAKAKAQLNEVVALAGAEALERAIRPVGPASDLARAMRD